MKLIRNMTMIYVLLFLTGCATNKYTSCVGWLPIYLDRKDLNAISSNLARDILKHNEHGKQLCEWKPVNKNSNRS
nr:MULTISPECIES: hypothetical protein [Bartonella]